MQITQTTREEPKTRPRVVFGSAEAWWAEAAAWSVIVFALAIGLAVLGWTYWRGSGTERSGWFGKRVPRSAEVAVETPAPPPAYRRAADGAPLEAPDAGPYFAVAIDNHVDARPLAGLSKAALVIEAPVEGGITRFLAFYPAGADVKRIGPVRSARPYLLDWASEFDALFVHVGGSPEALDLLKKWRDRDLNEFYEGKYFWRDTARQAPHSTYTSTDLLAKAATVKFAAAARPPAAWKFKAEPEAGELPDQVADLVIPYSTLAYQATWKYDPIRNDYRRQASGSWQRDEDNEPIRAKNIVVQYAKVRVLDEIGRRRIETTGVGRALIARDGQVVEGAWKRPDSLERLRFYDAAGAEIEFNPGPTWIEVVPLNVEVSY